jgi:chaperone required for assembly of F1-ATPase
MYHLNADLLLLREDPGYEEGELSRLQADAWDGVVRRVLDRLGLHCGGREQSNPLHPLAAAHGGLMAEPVPEPAAAVFRAYLGAVPTAEGLVALEAVAAAGRSLLAAVALREGVLAAGDFSTAVRVDERFQQGRWGFVEGAHDVEEATLAVTASAAQLVWAYEPDFARLAPPAPPSRVQFFSKSTEAKKNQN